MTTRSKMKNIKKFVIFGNPVEHSKSPQMHNAGFKYLNIDANYETKHLLNGNELKDTFLTNDFYGANITVPHKEEAYRQADEVVGIAKHIGAVNTYIKKNDKILAYNTDGLGFLKAVKSFGKLNKILIIGAGGTARAIAVALKQEKKEVFLLNRSQNKLEFFINLGINTYTWDNFKMNNFDLVINSTSAGLKDDLYPCDKKLLEKLFKKASFAFDCIYGKQTPFLRLALAMNLKAKDGEDMLLYQGVLAFELFTDTKATDKLIEAMRKGLTSSYTKRGKLK